MSRVWVTSDWHIGHGGISTKFRKQFVHDDHHDHEILGTALGKVSKRDVLFVLGDVCFTQKGLKLIDSFKFPCKMIMLKGNHDTLPTSDYLGVFDEVEGTYRYKGAFLTHIPIHESELYRGYNIHGHCHRGGPREHQLGDNWNQYYNAILEFNNYEPVDLTQVLKTLKDGR